VDDSCGSVFSYCFFRILGTRVSELEKKLKTLEMTCAWSGSDEHVEGEGAIIAVLFVQFFSLFRHWANLLNRQLEYTRQI
jgi:hypothetical protein